MGNQKPAISPAFTSSRSGSSASIPSACRGAPWLPRWSKLLRLSWVQLMGIWIPGVRGGTCGHTHTHVYIYVYLFIYLFIDLYREREREWVVIYIYIHIHNKIYMCVCRHNKSWGQDYSWYSLALPAKVSNVVCLGAVHAPAHSCQSRTLQAQTISFTFFIFFYLYTKSGTI